MEWKFEAQDVSIVSDGTFVSSMSIHIQQSWTFGFKVLDNFETPESENFKKKIVTERKEIEVSFWHGREKYVRNGSPMY